VGLLELVDGLLLTASGGELLDSSRDRFNHSIAVGANARLSARTNVMSG
jgi:hypothetical protein